VSFAGDVVDVVASVEHFHVSGSVAGVGGSVEVHDVVVHVFVLVDVPVISRVSVGDLVGVCSDVIGLHFTELNERLLNVLLVLGEVLDIFPPVTWGSDEVATLNLKLDEGVFGWLFTLGLLLFLLLLLLLGWLFLLIFLVVLGFLILLGLLGFLFVFLFLFNNFLDFIVEWLFSCDVMFLWVGNEVASTDGVDVVLLSEVAGALGPVDAAAVLVSLLFIVGELDHVSVSLVVVLLLGEAVLWVGNSIWVGDPSVVIVVDGVDVVQLEWAFSPAGAVVLLALLSLPFIRTLFEFFLFFCVLILDLFWLLGFCWIVLGKSLLNTSSLSLLSEEGFWIVNVVKLLWAFRPAGTIVLNALLSVIVFLWTLRLNLSWWTMSLNLSQMMSLCFLVVVLRFMHIIGFCLHGKEVTWTNNIINIVMSVVELHVSRSISSVGGAVEVNNIIVHILILMDVSVIGSITIGEFIRVSIVSELNEVSSSSEVLLLLVLHGGIEVLVNNIVSWVALVLKILILVVVSVGDVVTGSDATL